MVDLVPLRYVAGVSWPRSGHHLLQRLLQSYFPSLLYCDFYGAETDCCKRIPCSRPKVGFSKSHDFNDEVTSRESALPTSSSSANSGHLWFLTGNWLSGMVRADNFELIP